MTEDNYRHFADDSLLVSEVFGPTLQGEGPSTGRTATFLRLGHCNLACTFCDTPYTWDWQRFSPEDELRRHSIGDLADELARAGTEILVITGGEPLLQQKALIRLLSKLPPRHFDTIEIETNGTVVPLPELVALVDQFNVSPKLANAGMSARRRIRPAVLTAMHETGKAVFKFVAAQESQLAEIDELCRSVTLSPIYIMPEGTTADAIIAGMRALVDGVVRRGWRMTARSHVLIWGDARGV
jgi:7-carboxy-7-deazaguanine synthase